MLADLGQVFAYLLTNRWVETRPRAGRFRQGEKDAAAILDNNPGLVADLSEFIEPLGFELQVWTETDAPGINRDGRVYLMVRSGSAEPPCFGEDRFLEIQREQGDARDVTAVWFLHIWLMMAHFLYTAIGRSPSEVLRYIEATVTSRDLLETVREHIEQWRKEGPPDNPRSGEVYRILTAHKGMEVQRRTNNFLRAMTEARLLEEVRDEPGLYRQTLLGAIEFQAHFQRALSPFAVEKSSLEQVAAIVIGNGGDTNPSPHEEASHVLDQAD